MARPKIDPRKAGMTPDAIKCVARVAAAGGLSESKAEALLEQVYDRAEAFRGTGVNHYRAAAEAMLKEIQDEAKLARLDALRNQAKRDAVFSRISAGGIGEADLRLRAILHGINTPLPDMPARYSIASTWKGLAANWSAAVDHQLEKLGLSRVAISGALDADVAREMWALNAGGSAAATGNAQARAIATVLRDALALVRNRLNEAGAQIGEALDFVAHTIHDPDKMRRAGGEVHWLWGRQQLADESAAFAAWWGKTEPLLAEKSFENVTLRAGESEAEARTRFGRSVWEALTTGIHKAARSMGGTDDGYIHPAFEGSRNLAKSLSEQRVLTWKDGESWHAYMQEFGAQRTIAEGVLRSLDAGARAAALMERLGTNPAGSLEMLLRRLQEQFRSSDSDGVRAFGERQLQGLRNVMAQLDGSAAIPANPRAAEFWQGLRNWQNMSSLGSVGVTHFASIWATVPAELVHHGVNRLESLPAMVSALFKGCRNDAQRAELSADIGAYAHGLLRHIQGQIVAADGVPGKVASMTSLFMRYTGIEYIFDHTQAGIRSLLSHNIGRQLDRPLEAVKPELSHLLGMYGIGRDEWELLRGVQGLTEIESKRYLAPNDALRIDPGAAEQLLTRRGVIKDGMADDEIARAVERLNREIGGKLSAYFEDGAAHGTITAGVRERALVMGDMRPGDARTEAWKMFMQFKMWPVAAITQGLGREFFTSIHGRGRKAFDLGMMVGLSALAGYLRMCVNDAATGKPRRELNGATLLAAAAQGGGLGIFGDYLFGEINRMGAGLESVAGPMAGDLGSVIRMFARSKAAAEGQGKADLWPDLARFAVKHLPGENLVYAKGALDYLLWYHLYEAASPGWWERTNRRLLKEQGRTMGGYLPGGGVPTIPQLIFGRNHGDTP